MSCRSTPESVLESIREIAERSRLGDRLSGSISADMLVRDPAAYDVREHQAIPQGVPQRYALGDVISTAIGFAKDEVRANVLALSKTLPVSFKTGRNDV